VKRRDFLKSVSTFLALTPVTGLVNTRMPAPTMVIDTEVPLP